MKRVCCLCKRVALGSKWVIQPNQPADTSVTHGYCPACYAVAMSDLMEYINTSKRHKGCKPVAVPIVPKRGEQNLCV